MKLLEQQGRVDLPPALGNLDQQHPWPCCLGWTEELGEERANQTTGKDDPTAVWTTGIEANRCQTSAPPDGNNKCWPHIPETPECVRVINEGQWALCCFLALCLRPRMKRFCKLMLLALWAVTTLIPSNSPETLLSVFIPLLSSLGLSGLIRRAHVFHLARTITLAVASREEWRLTTASVPASAQFTGRQQLKVAQIWHFGKMQNKQARPHFPCPPPCLAGRCGLICYKSEEALAGGVREPNTRAFPPLSISSEQPQATYPRCGRNGLRGHSGSSFQLR